MDNTEKVARTSMVLMGIVIMIVVIGLLVEAPSPLPGRDLLMSLGALIIAAVCIYCGVSKNFDFSD